MAEDETNSNPTGQKKLEVSAEVPLVFSADLC